MSPRGRATGWAGGAAFVGLFIAARSTSGWISIAAWAGCYASILVVFVATIILAGSAEKEEIRREYEEAGHDARDKRE